MKAGVILMASDLIREFNDDNFKGEVLEAERPVLVDFWAEWCMPCRMIAPTLDEIAAEFDGKVTVGKLDTDGSPATAMEFKITAIPTLIIFEGGQPRRKFIGLTSASDLRNALDEVLS